jgi:uncharacterized RDD family membrane protein YckC
MSNRERVFTTPEHVLVRLLPAGAGSRFLALLVDVAIVLALTLGIDRLCALVLPEGLGNALTASAALVISLGYHMWFEVRGNGQTPGKKAAGLRVVDGRGLPIRLEQSFVRNLVRTLDFVPLLYGLGAIVAAVDRDRRRLGDIVADTLVVRERAPLVPPAEILSRPSDNSLAVARVVRRVRSEIGLEEREFLLTLLLRADRLEPTARYDLMEEVGRYYREKLGVDDPHLSGERLVRGVTALLFRG